MLSPSGWWLVTASIDLRCGMDRLLVHVREVLDRNPFDEAAYVFRNRAATRIKVLCCDAQGTWRAVRRLQDGRFILPSAGASTWSLDPEQFGWLCAGVDWQRLSPQKKACAARVNRYAAWPWITRIPPLIWTCRCYVRWSPIRCR